MSRMADLETELRLENETLKLAAMLKHRLIWLKGHHRRLFFDELRKWYCLECGAETSVERCCGPVSGEDPETGSSNAQHRAER